MPNLFPIGYEEEIITEEEAADEFIGYRPGIAFDEILGDFVRDGRNYLLDHPGIESWKSWCYNAIITERYKHLAYGTDFGIEYDAIFGAETREAAESILTRQITECLLADPYGRTAYVPEISIQWVAPDAVLVDVTVQGIEDVTIDLTVYLSKMAA